MADHIVDRDEDLIEARAALRQTWPSLTDNDVADFPKTRAEAADIIHRRTGAPLDKIQTTLSELFGLVPERHIVDDVDVPSEEHDEDH